MTKYKVYAYEPTRGFLLKSDIDEISNYTLYDKPIEKVYSLADVRITEVIVRDDKKYCVFEKK